MMDDGQNGEFVTIPGSGNELVNSMQRYFTISNGIVKGRTYRFKYRVKNQIGWSEFSDETYILAASVPSKPKAPIYVSSTDASIELAFSEPEDNGGALITQYVLEINDGNGYDPVSTYTTNEMDHILTTTDDGIVAGAKYYFRIYA